MSSQRQRELERLIAALRAAREYAELHPDHAATSHPVMSLVSSPALYRLLEDVARDHLRRLIVEEALARCRRREQ